MHEAQPITKRATINNHLTNPMHAAYNGGHVSATVRAESPPEGVDTDEQPA
jgi:hypothetical protein